MSNIQEVLDRVYVNADDVSYINLYYEAIFLIYVKDSEGCLFGENIYDNNNKLHSLYSFLFYKIILKLLTIFFVMLSLISI